MTDDEERIKKACEKFLKLLEDPHPGLITWQLFKHKAIHDLFNETREWLGYEMKEEPAQASDWEVER